MIIHRSYCTILFETVISLINKIYYNFVDRRRILGKIYLSPFRLAHLDLFHKQNCMHRIESHKYYETMSATTPNGPIQKNQCENFTIQSK